MIRLVAGDAEADVAPEAGGRVASVRVLGQELLVEPGTDPLAWGSYPMAPWAGRVRDGTFCFAGRRHRLGLDLPPHAIHGTVYRRPWDVQAADGSRCRMACELGPGWPFAGSAVQELTLEPGGLRLTMEVRASRSPMPVTMGWHPWFRKVTAGGSASVELVPRFRWERDEAGIPSGRRVPAGPRPEDGWDDCFGGVRQPVVVRWPAIELTVEASCDDWVLFDQPAGAFCIEPQTGPPDALNLGAPVAVPGTPRLASMRWRWRTR